MAQPSEECPNCGAQFRRGRLACPECGSDARTGWRDAEDIDYLSVDLPDADGPEERGAGDRRRSLTLAVVLLLVAVFVLTFVLRA